MRFSAPGRINLIGEHTDYNFGFALPIALPERTVVSYLPADSGSMVVRSDREQAPVRFPLNTIPGDVTGWAAYVAGVVWALQGAGHHVPGGTMSVTGGVEMGSGLASSAALECATLGAILAATGQSVDPIEQARIAQRAENEYVGAPTGLLDQLAILFAEERRAQLIDFDSLAVESVAFDPDARGITLLLINSHATHQHADGEYAARRSACERAAADLGVSSLRGVQDRGPSALQGVSDPVDARRARHIITENQRAACLDAQRMRQMHLGALLLQGVDRPIPAVRRLEHNLRGSPARAITVANRSASLLIRTHSNGSPSVVIRTITDRRRCRSIPTNC